MAYLVLARKWRPLQFDDVAGQEHVTRTLHNAFEQDRLHHAFLFTGARGVGKTSCARILAKALNCRTGPTPTPCNECPSCKEITQGSSVDVFEIDGASNRGIDEIRNLREGVKYAPCRDHFKVYIIDEVHMLTEAAFNALLKTLEEPPSHVKFILATTEPQKIPATILSRCQRYDFKRIPPRELVTQLQRILEAEGVSVEEEGLQIIVREAEGSFRDALSLLDQVISYSGGEASAQNVAEILGLGDRRNLFEISRALLSGDSQSALEVVNRIHSHGYDIGQFTGELLRHVRDLLIITTCRNPRELLDITDSEIIHLRELVAGAGPEVFQRQFSILVKAAEEISRSPFRRMLLEMAVVRMASLAPPVPVDHLITRLEALQSHLELLGADRCEAAPLLASAPLAGHTDAHDMGTAPQPTRPPENEGPQALHPEGEGRAAGEEPPSEPAQHRQAPVAGTRERPPEPHADDNATAQPKPEEEPEVPQPEPPLPSAPPSLPAPEQTQELIERWEAMVEHIRQHKPLVCALLESAHPLEVDPVTGRIRLLLRDGARMLMEKLEDNRQILIDLWSREAGREIALTLEDDATIPSGAPVPPSLLEIRKQEDHAAGEERRERAAALPHVKKVQEVLGGEVRQIKVLPID